MEKEKHGGQQKTQSNRVSSVKKRLNEKVSGMRVFSSLKQFSCFPSCEFAVSHSVEHARGHPLSRHVSSSSSSSSSPLIQYVSPAAAFAAPARVINSVAPVIESMSSCAARVPETEYVSSSPAAAYASPTPVIDSVASAPAVTRKSEFEALRADTEAELLEHARAYAKLESEKADLAAQSLLIEEEQQAAQTKKKPKEAQQAASGSGKEKA